MKTALQTAGIIAFIAIAILAFRLYVEVPQIRRDVRAESQAWRKASDDQATAYRSTLDRQATEYRLMLDRQASESRAALIRELHPVTQQASRTLAAYEGMPQAVQPVIDSAQRTVDGMAPVLASSRGLIDDSDRAVRMWTPQVLGLLAASKVTAGETATTMRDWRRATPALIEGVNQVVANSNRTTEATAAVMNNFREATKPLPRWLRIGLGIAPPLAQTAAGAATTFALSGR